MDEKIMNERIMNVMINKAGGKASAGTLNYRISIPNKWAQDLKITKENRSVVMTYDENRKIITIYPKLNSEVNSFVIDTLETKSELKIYNKF